MKHLIDTSGLINVDGTTFKYKISKGHPLHGWIKIKIYNDKNQPTAEHLIPYDANEKRAFRSGGCRYKIIKKAINIYDIKFI